MKKYIKLMRPSQYAKNLFVLAPLFFGKAILDLDLLLPALGAFLAFSIAASSIYIFNDFFDRHEDRLHPEKKFRPIASGEVDAQRGLALSGMLFCMAILCAWTISWGLLIILLAYFVINACYSVALKHIPVLDLNIIAVGFCLRLMAGSWVTGIELSAWLVLITYLLALFLALAKRRSDVVLAENGLKVRRNMEGYNLQYVDISLGMLASIITVSYIFYCNSPEVQQRYQSNLIFISVIFVINGLLRYLKLAIVDQATASPVKLISTDRFLQTCIGMYALLIFYLLYFNE